MENWTGIEEFVAVARSGSFAAAAKDLGTSRTHMSRSIARLEDRLRAKLLHRTTRKVGLTPTGRVFLPHCERLVQERDEAIAAVSEQGEPQGELRITCSSAIGERYVAPIARAFANQYHGVQIYLDLSNTLVDLIEDGFDLAIRTGHLENSRLIATRIAGRQLHTCAAPDYLERRGVPLGIADLDGHACIGGSAATWQFARAGQAVHYRPHSRWRCNNGRAVFDAAIEGMGICQLPDFYVNKALQRGQLVAVLQDMAAPEEAIWAVYPDRRHLSPKLRKFVEYLRVRLPDAMRNG